MQDQRRSEDFIMLQKLAGLFILALCALPVESYGADFFLAPDGDDRFTGTRPERSDSDGPFMTLERAREAIRERRRAGRLPDEPVTIHLRAGRYERTEPLALTENDAGSASRPIIWRAYRDEVVTISGGRRISDFTPVTDQAVLDRLPPDARHHVLQSDLKAQGITNYGQMTSRGFGRQVHPAGLELFFNHKPMTVARWPNEGWVRIAEVPGDDPRGGKFTYAEDRPDRWTRAEDLWIHGFWTWDWADSYEKVASIDTETKTITTAPPHGVYGYKKNARWRALNLLEELDQPGEWYLNRDTGILYFWPPSPVKEAVVEVSIADKLITMENVDHVTWQGIAFDLCRGDAIEITGGTHNQVKDCLLRNLGNRAVVINGGTGHRVVGCDIHNTGDGGIVLAGGDRPALTPGGHEAVNNDIHHFSRWSITYRPAVSISGVGQRLAHNHIHHAPHMGVALHGNEHAIEYNEFDHLCMITDDAGAVYMGRDYTQRGNVFRYNYFHHIGDYSGHIGVMSVYLDDFTSDAHVHGNIFYRAGRAILVGGGRDNLIENNIFVDCRPAIHVDARGKGWARNYFDGRVTTLEDRLAAMPYREPPWSERYPELLTLYDDDPAQAKYNVIRRNIIVGEGIRFLDGLNDEIVTLEDNLIDQDPAFVDPERLDFRLRPDSPAFDLGFQAIPVSRIGLQAPENGVRPRQKTHTQAN